MSQLAIRLADGRTAWAPGETMSGRVSWRCARAPRLLELRLIWRTTCAAGDEACTAELSRIEDGTPAGERPFTLRAPLHPFTYRGGSLRIDWLMELIDIEARVAARVDLIIGPDRGPVTLDR